MGAQHSGRLGIAALGLCALLPARPASAQAIVPPSARDLAALASAPSSEPSSAPSTQALEEEENEELRALEPPMSRPASATQPALSGGGPASRPALVRIDLDALLPGATPFAKPLAAPAVVETTLQASRLGPQHVVVLLPPGYSAAADPYPVVVALHGYSESLGTNLDGARAWVDTYGLAGAEAVLARGRLERADFGGLVSGDRLAEYNRLLAAHPYRGVVVACVYTPDFGTNLVAFDAFVTQDLLPFLRATFRVSNDRKDWAIEGVSLGGHHALLVGLRHPELFGTVAGMQPAIGLDMDDFVTQAAANNRGPDPQRVHLVTSDGDAYLLHTLNYAAYLKRRHVPDVDLAVVPGPHGYAFNQGPAAVELLFYEDRIARGLDPVASDFISTKIHRLPKRRRRRRRRHSMAKSPRVRRKKLRRKRET